MGHHHESASEKDLYELAGAVTSKLLRYATPTRLILLTLLITIVKSGVRVTYNLDTFRSSVQNFSSGNFYWRTSLALPIFSRTFKLNSEFSWLLGYAALTTILLLIPVALYLAGPSPSSLLIGLLIAASQIPVVALTELGRFDVFVLLGSLVMGLSSRYPALLSGAALISFGNFEHFIVIGVVMTILSFESCALVPPRKIMTVVATTGIGTLLTHQILFGELAAFTSQSRGAWLIENAGKYLTANLASLPQLIYSGYGSIWIFVIGGIALSPNRLTLMIRVFGLLVLPLLFTLLTADGTRIFVSVSTAGMVFVARSISEELRDQPKKLKVFARQIVLMALITPALNVEVLGKIKQPYFDILKIVSDIEHF